MERLGLTAEALKHLVETDDVSASLKAEHLIEALLASAAQLEQKIENLQLVLVRFSPILLHMEHYPKRQHAESIRDYIDDRLQALKEAQASAV